MALLNTYILRAALLSFLLLFCCSMKRYTRPELEAFTKIEYTPRHKKMIEPLVLELSVVMKELFFLKHNVAAMKDKLWDGGSNHRIMKINDDITLTKREITNLNTIRREILNAIYKIMPGFKEPVVVGYKGDKKKYERMEKMNRPIILASLEDQVAFNAMKGRDEKVSDDKSYKETINVAMIEYNKNQAKNTQPLTPIGVKGPVKKITRKEETKKRKFTPNY